MPKKVFSNGWIDQSAPFPIHLLLALGWIGISMPIHARSAAMQSRINGTAISPTTPSVMMNASDRTIDFNALDYWSGRLVQGIGFGFEQYLTEKEGGNQQFDSTPNLYYRLHPQAAVSLTNEIAIREVATTDQVQYETNPIQNDLRITGQIRPVETLQLYPYMTWRKQSDRLNTHFSGDKQEEIDDSEQTLGLYGLVISGNGDARVSPSALTWMHYLSDSLTLIGHKQWMMRFNAAYSDRHIESFTRELSDEAAPFDKLRDDRTTHSGVTADIRHGLSKQCWMGLKTRFLFRQYQVASFEDWVDPDQKDDVTRLDWSIQPQIAKLWNRQWLGRMQVTLAQTLPNLDEAQINLKPYADLEMWEQRISGLAGWISDTETPMRSQFLANYQGVIGNRLPYRTVMIRLEMDMHQRNLSDPKLEGGYEDLSEMRSQSWQSELQLEVGATKSLELGYGLTLNENRYRQEHVSAKGFEWNSRKKLAHAVTVDYANFDYSTDIYRYYGWSQLSDLEQRIGALLRPGMATLTTRLDQTLIRSADEDFILNGRISHARLVAPFVDGMIDNAQWKIQSRFAIGLLSGCELKGVADWYGYDSDERNIGDPDWRWALSLTVQPWKTFRLVFTHHAENRVHDVYTYPQVPPFSEYLMDKRIIYAWTLRLHSHF